MSEIESAAAQIADILPDEGYEDGFEQEEIRQETDNESEEQLNLAEEADSEDEEEVTPVEEDALDEVEDSADDEPGIESLQQLADALEVPLEELMGSVTSTFKASGEEVTATLAELQKSYQQEADYRKKSMALGDEKRGFEATRQKSIEQFQANHAGLAAMTDNARAFLKAEFDSPQLQSLRESNPAEWQARRTELQDQFTQLTRVRQEAAGQYEGFLKSQHEAYVQTQGQILAESVEGWGEEKLEEAVEAIRGLGFQDEELSNVVDARLFQGALRLKAAEDRVRELEAQIAKGSSVAQRVKQLPPKMLKSSGKGKVKASGLSKKMSALRKSSKGTKDNTALAAAVIEDLI